MPIESEKKRKETLSNSGSLDWMDGELGSSITDFEGGTQYMLCAHQHKLQQNCGYHLAACRISVGFLHDKNAGLPPPIL